MNDPNAGSRPYIVCSPVAAGWPHNHHSASAHHPPSSQTRSVPWIGSGSRRLGTRVGPAVHGAITRRFGGGHQSGREFFVDEFSAAGGESAQRTFFRVTDNIPEEAWYWLALASIGLSASLKLGSKNDWALFVGQWPPTFILFGLYHRLIHPSTKP